MEKGCFFKTIQRGFYSEEEFLKKLGLTGKLSRVFKGEKAIVVELEIDEVKNVE